MIAPGKVWLVCLVPPNSQQVKMGCVPWVCVPKKAVCHRSFPASNKLRARASLHTQIQSWPLLPASLYVTFKNKFLELTGPLRASLNQSMLCDQVCLAALYANSYLTPFFQNCLSWATTIPNLQNWGSPGRPQSLLHFPQLVGF